MRVAYFTHYSALYGANRSLLCLLDGLRDGHIEPIVLLPENGPLVRELETRRIPHHVLPFCLTVHWPPPESSPRWRKTLGHVWQRFQAGRRSRRNLHVLPGVEGILRDFNVDLVHTNSSLIRIGIQSALALNVPHVWHIREFGAIDWGFHQDGGDDLAHQWLAKSDSVVFVSKDLRSYYTNGRSLPRSVVIYNGILPREEFRRLKAVRMTLPRSRPGTRFAMVGYVNRSKGQHLALEALGRVLGEGQPATLTIIGDGDLAELRNQSDQAGVAGNVEILGFVPDVTSILLECDVLLMCSEREAFGRVTVEALASGCAVIARNSGGSSEIIEDQVSGLIFDGSAEDLAEKMALLCGNEELGRRLARHGAENAGARFATEDCVKEVLALYNRVSTR